MQPVIAKLKISYLKKLFFAFALIMLHSAKAQPVVHVWEMQELTLAADSNYSNAYTEVTVWVDLKGPGFNKRVYGFWDGTNTFRVRVIATTAGTWTWKSGSNKNDRGLIGVTGSFTAINWTEAEKAANPLRRGFIRASANQHALNYADGTPYLAIGDTWFSMGASRFRWYDDDIERPIGPTAGFKDYVRYRKAQGYKLDLCNCCLS